MALGANKGSLEVLVLKMNVKTCSNGYKLDEFRFKKKINKKWSL